MSDECVLVTGATGFVGSHLVESLLINGFYVRALTHSESGARGIASNEVELIRGDVTDIASVTRALRGCRRVYHLAAAMPHRGYSRREIRSVNVEGTRNVGRAALRTGLERVVLGSSTGVYGGTAAAAIDEKAPATPDSPYRASKRDAEQVLLALHEAEGLSVAITRPSSMVGWRSSGWLRLCGAISTGRFLLVGQGRNRVHLCPVAEAVAGLELCGEVPAADGEAFILCADRPTTARGLVSAFAEELGVPGPVGSLPAAPFRVMRAVNRLGYRAAGVELGVSRRYDLFFDDKAYDNSKAKQKLGLQPRASVREAVRDTVRWYREQEGR